jgi:hypothetical protein
VCEESFCELVATPDSERRKEKEEEEDSPVVRALKPNSDKQLKRDNQMEHTLKQNTTTHARRQLAS